MYSSLRRGKVGAGVGVGGWGGGEGVGGGGEKTKKQRRQCDCILDFTKEIYTLLIKPLVHCGTHHLLSEEGWPGWKK